jgi:hypothetical protein
MKKPTPPEPAPYTCADYREEMILLGLRKQLSKADLTDEEKDRIISEITRLEKIIGF